MLKTEERNQLTKNIDSADTMTMLSFMQAENANAVNSVDRAIGSIAQVIDNCFERIKNGGRLFYVGCGTSGRLGVLDASECPPTFGVSPNIVIGIIAGGDRALRYAVEGAEDDENAGAADLSVNLPNEKDCVIGISAAGGAKYVVGALKYAKEKGAYTACITSNQNTPVSEYAQNVIFTDTGAEVITGSTRMKAGTAQKLVLNMISTSLMIKLGYVYENLMINLKPTNKKLKERMINIVCEILHCEKSLAQQKLEQADWNIRKAVQMPNK